MRVKNKIESEDKKDSFGVTDGLDFDMDLEPDIEAPAKIQHVEKKESNKKSISTDIDPNRNYSPYYTPKPKVGSKGGTLGRGAVPASERKIQFSVTCTPAQKERFKLAAQNDHRKLPDLVCLAIEEYIKNHNL